jgi:streptogramin lyase
MNKISMRNYIAAITRVLLAGAALLLTADGVLSANPRSLSGVVQTGGTSSSQPLPNVHVSLFEATTGQPIMIGQSTTDASGRFSIRYTRNTSQSIFFVQAEVGQGVEFVTILGPNLPASVTINELTTVAASYSMAQFLRTGVISGNSFGLQIAAGMNDNIVAFATGQSSSVLLNSPNADQTNSLRSTRSLANLLAACVVDPSVTASLFDLTTPAGGSPPSNTAQALANLARDPGQNVNGIYDLTLLSDLYDPPLVTMPDAWTVTVKINDSGSDEPGFLISGPGNLAFDRRGYAWVTNNTIQGTPCSGRFNLVFKPNGQPADGRNGTPRSPLTGGGILGGGFGVTIDPRGSAWFGNFGWGNKHHCTPDAIPSKDGNGSISRFTLTGMPVSPPDAYQGGPVRAQGLAADAEGNIWISSFKNDSVYVFRHGNPHQSVGVQPYHGAAPFDVAIASDGTAWVSNTGGLPFGEFPRSIAKYALVNGALQQQFLHFLPDAHGLRGLSLDSQGNAWLAALGSNRIYMFGPDGTELRRFDRRGGMDAPWDIVIDGEDNVWVANFGPLQQETNFTGRLTKLWGINPPPGHNVGDPISPPTGYTIPTAGSEVLLHNGAPLYSYGQPPGPPCFIPMMRQTAVVIDQAGNIWSINNWKPDFDIDTVGGNPGGDGIIIFVGLAAPPTTQVH